MNDELGADAAIAPQPTTRLTSPGRTEFDPHFLAKTALATAAHTTPLRRCLERAADEEQRRAVERYRNSTDDPELLAAVGGFKLRSILAHDPRTDRGRPGLKRRN